MVSQNEIHIRIQHFKGMLGGLAQHNTQTHLHQLVFQDLSVCFQIIDDHNLTKRAWDFRMFDFILVCHWHSDTKAKTGPHPFFAGDPYFATHQTDKPLRNCEPKAGPIKLAIALILNLIEFAKDVINFVFWDTDSSVLNRDVDLAVI